MNKYGRRAAIIATLTVMAVLIPATGLRAEDPKSPVPLTLSAPLTLSGYGQAEYISQQTGVSGFSIHRMRFALAGEILKNVKFKVQVDAVKTPILTDAYLDFGFHSAASVRVGQFKIPFSLEIQTSSADLDTIDRSQVVTKAAPGFDIGSSGRDIGAEIMGKVAFLEYAVAVLNGSGINKADTDDRKDVAARLVVHPFSSLSLGVAGYDGQTAAPTGGAPLKRAKLGLEAALLYKDLSVKAEFIQAEDGDTLRQGWYAQGGYFILPNTLQAVVKFDSYDPDRNQAFDRTDIWVLGANWFLAGRTKLQVTVVLTKDEAGNTVNKAIQAQFQAAF
jgi:phosphate-selective porin OprO/OprP